MHCCWRKCKRNRIRSHRLRSGSFSPPKGGGEFFLFVMSRGGGRAQMNSYPCYSSSRRNNANISSVTLPARIRAAMEFLLKCDNIPRQNDNIHFVSLQKSLS